MPFSDSDFMKKFITQKALKKGETKTSVIHHERHNDRRIYHQIPQWFFIQP